MSKISWKGTLIAAISSIFILIITFLLMFKPHPLWLCISTYKPTYDLRPNIGVDVNSMRASKCQEKKTKQDCVATDNGYELSVCKWSLEIISEQ